MVYRIIMVLVVIIEITITALILKVGKDSIIKKYIKLIVTYIGLELIGLILRLTFLTTIIQSAYIWGYGLKIISGIFLGVAVYILPAIIAFNKRHNNKIGILLLNIFLGWSLLGWVGALIWACIKTNETNNINSIKYEDLERLQKLKDNGTITQEEFEQEKSKLLK